MEKDPISRAALVETAVGNMTYHGGPVQHTQKIFTIFWNPVGTTAFPTGYQSTINQFVQDLNGTPYYAIASQYSDAIGNISTVVSFGGTWLDTTNAFSSTAPTFDDLLAEVGRAQAANGWTSDANTYFQIYTPSGISNGDVVTGICGLHYWSNPALGQVLFPQPGCFPGSPYPNNQMVDAAINTSAHEIMETVTDPLGSAWFNVSGRGEIGDVCNFNFGTRASDGFNVMLSAHKYLIQQEWSNAVSGCAVSYSRPSEPHLVIETPSSGSTVAPRFTVRGWAIDRGAVAGTGVDVVHVYAYPNPGSGTPPVFLGVATSGVSRADIGTLYGSQFTNSGFTLAVSGLAPGGYQIAAFEHSTVSGTFNAPANTNVTVTATRRGWDFDGDGKADLAVFRPSTGTWYVRPPGTNEASVSEAQWGNGLDIPVPGDFDGDGITDIAVFRPSNGTWYIVYSSTGTAAGFQWGNGNDTPVPGDYDGDGKTDIAVFRPSNGTWYILYSRTGTAAGFQWGNGLDVPVPGDYDGDGITDIAVFRRSVGIWYIRYSNTGTTGGVQLGSGLDVPVPGDYDGDGKTDIAVFRPSNGTWYVRDSSTGTTVGVQFGNGLDKPVPGDYDGDGKTDVAVFRPSNGTWYVLYSSTGTTVGVQFGNGNDIPILKRP